MERSKTKSKLVVIWIIVGILTSASYAAPPSDRCILIKAQVANKEDTKTLVNMGLDIWEFQQDGVIIRVTDDERNQIIQSGFTIETITEDVYEYTEKIRQEQISLFVEPTPAKYHSYDEVITELIKLEDSGVAQTYIIGNTHEGRDIWAVRISDNPSVDEEEPGAIFLGCHHAREWISVEVPLYIAQYLANNYSTDEEIRQLIDNCQIWIVPVINPDGYEYSRTSDRMWRKNRRDNGNGTFGVDLNRNYDSMWGTVDASRNTSKENYCGPSAFSEPESQAIRDLVRTYDFRILMSYHSFWQNISYPWGYTWEPCPDEPIYRNMTSNLIELIFHTSGAVYKNWFDMPDTYLLSGDTADWSYGEFGIYSFEIELPPVTYSQGGFVLPESQIMPACVENLPVALNLISFAAADYGIENLTTGKTYNNIQYAIHEAHDGDEIVVASGVYHENINITDKNLTLRSLDPNDPGIVASTIIHLENCCQGSVITLSGHRNGGCELAGLTITGGQVSLSCCDASPMIRNCTIASNGSNAIEFWKGCEPPTIIDCNILGQVSGVNDPTLAAYWPLDETEDVVAHDAAGQHEGLLIGDPQWRPLEGQVDGALEFDGIDDYVSTDPVLNPADGAFSVFAWIKGGSQGQIVLSQAQGGANWLGIDSADGCLMTELEGAGRTSGGTLLSGVNITDGTWHEIALVWDGSCRCLYVDRAEVARDGARLSGLKGVHGGLYFGVGSTLAPGTFFSGLIDDVRIYGEPIADSGLGTISQR